MRTAVNNGTKITILGAGNVGATIAYTFAVAGTCSDIVLIDVNKEKAEGEAMDIHQGISFCHDVDVESILWLYHRIDYGGNSKRR